ncbi:MAG TPA: PilN domain-containing protein [Gemmatimonadales bacterium]
MITVNLKPGQRRKRAGNPLKGLLDNLSVFKELSAKVKDPLLMGAVGAWVLVIAMLGLLYLNNLRQLYVLEPRLEQARSENRRFKAFLADKRRQEKIRDSLLAQITVIKSVDGDRYIWPHLLDEITKALPAYTWLTDLGVSAPAAGSGAAQNKPAGAKADSVPAGPPPALTFQINGRTIDIQAYTRFLRQLEASPWIMDVTPVSAMTVVEKERPVTAFTIRASYNRADSAYIRTAPFSQSVR